MNLGRAYRTVLGSLIAAGLTAAWWAQSARIEGDQAITVMAREQTLLDSQLRDLEARRLKSRQNVTEAGSTVQPPPTAKSDGARALEEMKTARALHSDPHWQRLKLNAVRAGLFLEYAPFYRAQKLSADQIAQLENKITEYRTQLMDLQDAAQAQELPNSDPALVTLRKKAREQFAETASMILGPEGVQALGEFDDSGEERGVATQLATVLSTSPEPLSAGQYLQLVQLLRNSRQVSPFDPSDHVINWPELQTAAGKFLSVSQRVEFTSASAIPQRGEQIRELLARYTD